MQIPSGEKAAFIALVQAAPYPGGAMEAARLQQILNTYDDVTTAIYRELDLFAANNAYVTQGLSCFDNNNLQAAGIWFNYTTSSPPLTDPVLIVNSTISTDVVISATSPPYYKTLAILGPSTINRVMLVAGADLNELYIGPGSVVELLDCSNTGCIVNTVWLPSARSTPSRLDLAVFGSIIGQIVKDDDSFFGGYSNVDPNIVCGIDVIDLAYGIITHNTIQLTWGQSPPNQYLFVNTYYRIKGSKVWWLADESVGLFNGDTGFTFTKLNCDTAYEFQVAVTCTNGGISVSSILEVATTVADC